MCAVIALASATGSMPPEVETHLVNAVLTNGARYYVDHAHPELSTPECADARSVVVFDRAAELIALRSMDAAKRLLPEGQEIVVYKNNSDGKGNSCSATDDALSRPLSRTEPDLFTQWTWGSSAATRSAGAPSASTR